MTSPDGTDPDGHDPNAQADLATHLSNESKGRPDAAAAAPSPLLDMEKSLVERIADIDDERRRSSNQLRKALQTKGDELDRRLISHRLVLVALSALTLLLAVGVAWIGIGLYIQSVQLTEASAEVRAAVEDAAGKDRAETPLGDRPVARIGELEDRLAALQLQAGTAAERLTERIEAIDLRLRELAVSRTDRAVAASSGYLLDGRMRVGGQADASDDRPLGNRPSPTDPELQGEAPPEFPRERPRPESHDLQGARERLETQMAAAREQQQPTSGRLPIDQLIDDQLDRLEREYQRLLQEVEAPAVQLPGRSTAIGVDADSGAPRPRASDVAEEIEVETAVATTDTSRSTIALQLIGFRGRDELRAFLSDHAMPNPVYVRNETYRGRPWFALIHSLHDDRESAADAVAGLPDDLSRLDLWLRELPAGTRLEQLRTTSPD